jgi:hypothetical protein
VIATQAEIDLVKNGALAQLRLPFERGQVNELLPCPVEEGQLVRLQPRPGAKAVPITVTRAEWTVDGWLVRFVLGNRTAFFAKHRERYLKRKGVGITTDPKLAVKGEPAVTTEEEMQLARSARARRDLEDEQNWLLQKQAVEQAIAALRSRNDDREIESDLRFLENRLAKMGRRRRERAA